MKSKLIPVVIGAVIIIAIAVFGNICRIKDVDIVFSEDTPTATAEEIYSVLGIETGTSILSVNETDFRTRIQNAYPDRTVELVDVVRSFPDKMTIYIDYNPAVLAVRLSGNNGYVLTDTEFQSTVRVAETGLDKNKTIVVKGVAVTNTFNSDAFRELYELLSALKSAGADYEKLVAMFSEIKVGTDRYSFTARGVSDMTFSVPKSDRVNAGKYFSEYVNAFVSR